MRNRLIGLGAACVVFLVGASIATQEVAEKLHFSVHLGAPLLRWGRTGLYPPWQWMLWNADFGDRAPALFEGPYTTTTIAALIALAISVCTGQLFRKRKASDAHGTARFAETRELKKAGLLVARGVVLCQTAEAKLGPGSSEEGDQSFRVDNATKLLRHDGPEHVLVSASTRSGKGISAVITTLLSWTHSALIFDTKKELWWLTAGWRRLFSRVLCWEPSSPDSVSFNFLADVRPGDNAVRDAMNLADILIDPSGTKKTRSHWDLTAHELLVAAILHVLYAEADKSLHGVWRFLNDPARPAVDTYDLMLNTRHLPDGPHEFVASVARSMLDRAHEEQSGILSTAKSCLTIFGDRLVARATSRSDFRIADLMDGDRPTSLYIVVAPGEIDSRAVLVRLLINQIGRRLSEEPMTRSGKSSHKFRLLVLLDEFTVLGPISFFKNALGFVAGYAMKCMLVIQSLSQLADLYGEQGANAILDNCAIKVLFGSNDEKTNERISRLLSTATHLKTQRSFRWAGLFGRGGKSESDQEHGRPLMTPGEVQMLPREKCIVLAPGLYPYLATKAVSYADARFKTRASLPTPDSPEERATELPPARPDPWAPFAREHGGVVGAAKKPKKKCAKKKAKAAAAAESVESTTGAAAETGNAAAAEDKFAAAAAAAAVDPLAGWGDVLGGGSASTNDV
jgi:type IV secretion system protein VirD4